MALNIISNINFQRIEWCCHDVNISLQDAHSKLKIPLEKLQQGPLTRNQLKKVAKHFGYTPLFFLEKGLPKSESVHSLAFRTLAEQSAEQSVQMDVKLKKLIKQVEWHRDVYISLSEDIEEPASFQPPELSGSIEQKAAEVRQWLGLPAIKEFQGSMHAYDFTDYRQLIEDKGILVFQSNGYNGSWQFKNEHVAGFSIQHPEVPVIFIRKTSPPMQTFTLFHELGHLLMHDTSYFDSKQNLAANTTRKIERQANQFAGNCLIPPSLLNDIIPQIPNSPEEYVAAFSPVTKKLGVSVEAVLVALQQKSAITWNDYKEWKEVKEWEESQEQQIQESESEGQGKSIPRTYRHREPINIFGEHYVGTVLEAHDSGFVTINKTSNYLDRLKISDIRKLEQFLFEKLE